MQGILAVKPEKGFTSINRNKYVVLRSKATKNLVFEKMHYKKLRFFVPCGRSE
jgi:hypothetical protein